MFDIFHDLARYFVQQERRSTIQHGQSTSIRSVAPIAVLITFCGPLYRLLVDASDIAGPGIVKLKRKLSLSDRARIGCHLSFHGAGKVLHRRADDRARVDCGCSTGLCNLYFYGPTTSSDWRL